MARVAFLLIAGIAVAAAWASSCGATAITAPSLVMNLRMRRGALPDARRRVPRHGADPSCTRARSWSCSVFAIMCHPRQGGDGPRSAQAWRLLACAAGGALLLELSAGATRGGRAGGNGCDGIRERGHHRRLLFTDYLLPSSLTVRCCCWPPWWASCCSPGVGRHRPVAGPGAEASLRASAPPRPPSASGRPMIPESWSSRSPRCSFTIGVVVSSFAGTHSVIFMSIGAGPQRRQPRVGGLRPANRQSRTGGSGVLRDGGGGGPRPAVGPAIIVAIFRVRQRLSVDELSVMRWWGAVGGDMAQKTEAKKAVRRRRCRAGPPPARRHYADPPLRGESGRSVRPGQDRWIPPPLHR